MLPRSRRVDVFAPGAISMLDAVRRRSARCRHARDDDYVTLRHYDA